VLEALAGGRRARCAGGQRSLFEPAALRRARGMTMLDRSPEQGLVTRAEVEDLLYEEAACLDDWRLDDWLALLTDDASYVVPATDARGAGSDKLPLIADDIRLLRERIAQLKGPFT